MERAIYDFLASLIFDKLFDPLPQPAGGVDRERLGVPRRSVPQARVGRPRKMPGYFSEPPVETFRRHVWINPFWEDDVNETVAQMGADRVIFGSDWPHIEGMPAPLDYTVELKAFDDDARHLILRDNAEALNQRRPA